MNQKTAQVQSPARRRFIKGTLGLAGVAAGSAIEHHTKAVTTIATITESTIFDRPKLPRGDRYENWTKEEAQGFELAVHKDRAIFGKKAWNRRKWWYESVYELNLHEQKYKLSCEFNSLYKLLKFNNVPNFKTGEPITEDLLINKTPINKNPKLGRPANINAEWGKCPPNDYGVYAKALAGSIAPHLPNGVKLNAFDSSNFNPNGPDIREQYKEKFFTLADKGPFIFWFQQDPTLGTTTYYDTENNANVLTAPTQHCAICLAVSEDRSKIMYADPINNGIYYMCVEGDMGLVKRAQNVDFNLLSLEKNY